MSGALFSLVNAQNHDEVFAWGMEVPLEPATETEEEQRAAVVYRRGFGGERDLLSVHDSAEAACRHYNRITAVDLVWDADDWYEALVASGRPI